MRTVQASETAVSIWFSREAAPTREQMLELVRQALMDRGLDPWPDTEAECFSAGEDMLIIARPGRAKALAFAFPDLEALLMAVASCPDGASSLYDPGEDGYILTVAPEAAGAGLWDCGEEREVPDDWLAHAVEQGRCLLDGGAISDLKRYFSL